MLASKIGESVRALWNPVHAATGAKVLSGEEDCDFELPARFPLIWQRIYNSRNPHEGLFGRGWRTAFETRVVREEEYTCFHDEGGANSVLSVPRRVRQDSVPMKDCYLRRANRAWW